MRRRLLIGSAVLGGLLLFSALGLWLLYGQIGTWVVREKVIPRIERRLGRDVHVGTIDVERGRVVLRKLSVAGDEDDKGPLVEIEEIVATYDYGASWTGEVIVHDVTIDGLRAHLRRRADGSNNFRDLVRRVRGKRGPAVADGGDRGGMGRLRPRSTRLLGGSVSVRDEGSGSSVAGGSLRITGLTGRIEDGSDEAVLSLGRVEVGPERRPRASLGGIDVTIDLSNPLGSAQAVVGTGEVFLWSGMTLTGISGTVEQGETPGQLVIDLTGSYRGSTETLWRAEGWLEPREKRGQLAVKADHFTFDRIANVLEDSMVKDFSETSIDAELFIEVDRGKGDITGRLDLSGLNIEHEMLAAQTVRDIGLNGEVAASFDSRARTLELVSMTLVSKGVTYQLRGSVALPGGLEPDGARRASPRLSARLAVPTADCQAVLESIPAELVPKLQGFELTGPFDAEVLLEIDWSDLEELTVLDGSVGLAKCKIIAPSDEFDTERLMNSFEHHTLVGPEEYETVDIGLESDNYAQIFDISPHFLGAVMTQEDSRFYEHEGFIPREFRTALVRNLQAGHFKFGASSITMQMVKNVFLYREKTISRKLQELFLTWYVEQTLEKNRILEIYVNAIEYGPGVYGIVKASDIYLDKHPRDIQPAEAAFLAQLLPSPRRRYFQYCKEKLGRRTRNKIARVLNNMNKRDRLSDEELAEASLAPIEFNPQKVKELCKKLPDW